MSEYAKGIFAIKFLIENKPRYQDRTITPSRTYKTLELLLKRSVRWGYRYTKSIPTQTPRSLERLVYHH
jgi:hypothetical protein